MDGNSHTNDGFLHHFLDPQSGHSVFNLVRGILPGHRQQSQGAAESEPPLSSGGNQAAVQPLESAILTLNPERISSGSGLNSELNVPGPSGTAAASCLHSLPHATTSPTPMNPATSDPPNASDSIDDVDMIQEFSASSSSNPSQSSASLGQSRSTRRARVDDEDDEDGDYLRESNRQRMDSPTTHEDEHEHHFMPIPEDHGVPQSGGETTRSAERNAHGATEEAQQGQAPPPPYSRMMWTFDFVPIPTRNGQGQGQGNVRVAEGGRADDHPQEANHDGHPFFNFFIDFPIPGHQLPPQPGTVPNNNAANDGGNLPANAGFAIPPLPFLFGMDHLEERDDPERAMRLVDGLEDVPVGLVKRMQRVGGPGTSQGDVPCCAVCWESLLEPEGGGFEGNAELAKAEADQAARDTAASQQTRESSMDSAPSSSSSGQPSSDAPTSAPSTTMPEPSGEKKCPRIVVLPCSHAFHATCLLPWFSKPGRTTCPSCRFDIDPDSLTYRARPLRAHPHPHPALQPGAAPQAQQQPLPHILFGPPPPPPPAQFEHVQPAQNQAVPNGTAGVPEPQPAHGQQPAGQQRQQPLPPFVSFDISMIIPIFPGRGAPAAAPPPPGAQSAQGTNAVPPNDQGPVPPPPPPRTDNHGFRLDNTLLQEAVVSTFQRILRQHPPPPFSQAPPVGGPAPGENGPRPAPEQQWYTFAGHIPGFPPMPPPNAHAVPQGAPHHRSGARRPAEKQQWTPPPAPGPTLRQVIERNEREMGLRCSDVSCGLGPFDDDPVSTMDLTTFRQIAIRPSKSNPSGKEAVCEHKFHPSCLVSAERVAGWGHEVKTGEPAGDGEDVEVSCPVCRAVGVISRLEWEEGACALA